MEWVFAGVVVIDDNFDYIVSVEDEGVGVDTVNGGVRGGDAC